MLNRLRIPLGLAVCLITTSASGATVDGMPIHSTSTGNGSRTVILVHGWTCDSSSWDAQVPPLAKDYRVIALDLPGHGKSGSPRDGVFSMDLFVRAIEAVRADARAERVVLVGHSMGAAVIVAYTQLFPQRVAALVAVDGTIVAPPGVSAGFEAARARAAAAGRTGGGFPSPDYSGPEGLKARESMIRGMFVSSTPKTVQDKVLKMMLKAPEATASGASQASFRWMATADATVRTVPVLGLYAENSRAGNVEEAKRSFPAFEYNEIPGTGHFLMMEKPQEFNERLTRFLANVRY